MPKSAWCIGTEYGETEARRERVIQGCSRGHRVCGHSARCGLGAALVELSLLRVSPWEGREPPGADADCPSLSPPQPAVHQGEAGAGTERPRGSPRDLQTNAATVAGPVQLLPAGVSGCHCPSGLPELTGSGCQGNHPLQSGHMPGGWGLMRMFE